MMLYVETPVISAGLPQSIIMNGQGFYGDCQLNPVNGAASLPCNVTAATVKPDESQQQPWASAANPGALQAHAPWRPLSSWRDMNADAPLSLLARVWHCAQSILALLKLKQYLMM